MTVEAIFVANARQARRDVSAGGEAVDAEPRYFIQELVDQSNPGSKMTQEKVDAGL
jgi:hypothetical protein